mgnify:CR=1 FL=1|jgi:hypothetical protein
MRTEITNLCKEIIGLKLRPGTKILIQKLQQKIDDIMRQASDTQATRKTD